MNHQYLAGPVLLATTTADISRMPENEDFWDLKRESPFQWVVTAVDLGLIYVGTQFLLYYEPRSRLFAPLWLFLYSGGWIVVTTVHELGHAAMAWCLGFRFRALNIGPLTIVKDPFGHRHVHIAWRRLLHTGGYASTVPTSEKHVRSNKILVVSAGPLASLLAGLLCWLLYLKGPGLIGDYWGIPAVLAIVFGADFITNLIPIGYTDGTMLLHLLAWTENGRDLAALLLSSKADGEAVERRIERDFAGEIELRQQALDQLLATGVRASQQVGYHYRALAIAQLNHGRHKEAAGNLHKSLEAFAQNKNVEPIHVANSWEGLELIYRLQHRVAESKQASDAMLDALAKVLEGNLDAASEASVSCSIAEVYANTRRYELGVREVEHGLKFLTPAPKYMLQRAELLRMRMRCESGLGDVERARETTLEAARILRSPDIAPNDRSGAASSLANLAQSLWWASDGRGAAELLRESIQRREEIRGSSRTVGLRIFLAHMLAEQGKFSEAEAALPEEAEIDASSRKAYLEAKAAVYLNTGRVNLGLAASEEALQLAGDGSDGALAQANLAEFLLASGREAEAEDLARKACDYLLPLRHPGAAEPLVTLALIGPVGNAPALIEQAVQLVEDAPFLASGSRERALEGIKKRSTAREVIEPAIHELP
jgi:tetratricopeptide (TPR) repeat protein